MGTANLRLFFKPSWNITKNNPLLSGFTLIELLVVLVILSVLVTMTIISINPISQIAKAKDAQRQHDLLQIRNALDTYFNDANGYPASLTIGGQFKNGAAVYMQKIPQDPDYANGNASYAYETETTSSNPQWNVLFAKLSNPQNLQVSCSLLQMTDSAGKPCVPTNFQSLGYNYCALSGKVNCDYITANPVQGISVPTPSPTSVPTSTPTPTPTPSPTPTPTPPTCLTGWTGCPGGGQTCNSISQSNCQQFGGSTPCWCDNNCNNNPSCVGY